MMQSEEERAQAAIFQDPAFSNSCHFKLSTSNLSPGEYYLGGFGAVVPEGYGLNYGIAKEGVKFNVSSWENGGDAAEFGSILRKTLDSMRNFFE